VTADHRPDLVRVGVDRVEVLPSDEPGATDEVPGVFSRRVTMTDGDCMDTRVKPAIH
jgi:hypothetical protein